MLPTVFIYLVKYANETDTILKAFTSYRRAADWVNAQRIVDLHDEKTNTYKITKVHMVGSFDDFVQDTEVGI